VDNAGRYSTDSTLDQILSIAGHIEETPHPQAVIDLLHERLFGAHIGGVAMLLYGPMHEDAPRRPFDHAEIVGSWSKPYGSGVGSGMRLSIKRYADLIAQLEDERVVVYEQTAALRSRFDPLVRGLMRAARLRSIAIFALGAGDRKLGAVFIGTDRPYRFSAQELLHYRLVLEMITISLRAQVLRQQHDRVQQGRAALLDAVTDGVVMITPGGGKRGGKVLTINARFTHMFGVSERTAENLSLATLLDAMRVPENIRLELRSIWLRYPIQDPNLQQGEISLVDDDGRPRELAWYSAPVYQGAFILGRIYTFHDVTAERTSARLRAAFVSRVSHELRTPLTAIKGFAEFILESESDELPPLAREYTEIILDSAKHLNRIFNDMIEITRADAGELQLHKASTSINRLIRDVVGRTSLIMKGRGQTVALELSDTLPNVNIDTDRIIQVLTNLITNAGKYAPENSTITLSTILIDSSDVLSAQFSDVTLPAVLVTIRDQGQGISTEDTEKIFLPFFRTESARKQKVEGAGLGLSVVRSLVEMHQGKIWVVASEIAGSGCFQFTLPAR